MDDPHHHSNTLSFLTKGSQVEVSSSDDGFTGVWYVATVIHPPPSTSAPNRNNLVYIEYHNLLSGDGSSSRLREYANIAYVRPSPVADTNPPNFQLNDLVDAFYRDGWCTGVITTVVDDSNFGVTFQNSSGEVQFRCSDLRIHKKWVGGRWFQPQKQVTAGWMFTVGKKVEVSFESESLCDVWFPATVLKNLGNSTFLVEYQQPGAGDEAILRKVTVDFHHIRPCPPYLRDKNFVLLEKVDAYYDFGWWSGVITKELADNRYNVFFKHAKKEREFIYSRVRPHMEWKGGKWFSTSQGDAVVRTAHSLIDNQIEQETASIDKQSSVATSIMKRKREKNLDSIDKNLPKDKIMNDDSSGKNKNSSVGQSEGFDSEVSGTTDQAFSKTENLSHGKKVHSNRGKSIELKTPTTNTPRKRGKLHNELKSLQPWTKGTKLDSVKTRSQESVETQDATKDFLYVVMGLQCNRNTVSPGKMVQQLANEKTPDVAKSDTKQPGVPLAPLTVIDQEGREGDAALVAPKRKRGRPPKLQALNPKTSVAVNHEIRSVIPSKLSEVEADQRKEAGQRKDAGLTTSSGTKSLEENQGPANDQPGLAGKQNASPIKDKLPNKNIAKRYSARKGKRRTISINAESLAPDIQDASKEKAEGSLEKYSTKRKLEASVWKSTDVVCDDQPLRRWFVEKPSPITIHGQEGTMEQSSKANEGVLVMVRDDMDSGNLPFIRTTTLWNTIESMEAFQMLPQKPHFRPLLEGVREGAREGLAIGTMVTFSTVVDKTCSLRYDDPRSTIEDCLETLVELEANGFDIEVVRERLTALLLIKDKQEELEERSKGVVEKIEEHNIQRKKIEEDIKEIERQIRELEENRKQTLLKKEKRAAEIAVIETAIEGIKQQIREVGAEFDVLAAAPFVINSI